MSRLDPTRPIFPDSGDGSPGMETIVRKVYRMRNSRDGNPRFRLATEHGEMTTAKDSQASTQVDDLWVDTRVVVHLKDGEVVRIRAVTD